MPKAQRPDSSSIRLQKVMAAAGIGSRRACEALIEEGRVGVNGKIVRTLPVMVTPGVDKVTVDGEALERYMPKTMRKVFAETRDPRRRPLVYVMFYKPGATLTTMSDPDQRRTVADLVQHPSGIRLYPVGRLDYETLGLLVMTNDGELANRLTHPRYEVHKTYRAVVKGAMTEQQIEKLRIGTYLADRKEGRTVGASRTRGVDLTVVRTEPHRTVIDITLKEGRNRQVRRMLADAGCPVKKLVRIAMGPLMLKGLKAGQWRDLTEREVHDLHLAAQGKGPKAPGERDLIRSHAMQLGKNRERTRNRSMDSEVEAEPSFTRVDPRGRPPQPSRRPRKPAESRGERPASSPRAAAEPKKSGKGPSSAPAGPRVPPPSKPKRAGFPLAEPPPRLPT
ncbi:MAG: rRNA pseudouridine synthase [Phycisphaerae bacterium]|nr:rRNA pseudouridine synthase [Phycisphaerae bacterium]